MLLKQNNGGPDEQDHRGSTGDRGYIPSMNLSKKPQQRFSTGFSLFKNQISSCVANFLDKPSPALFQSLIIEKSLNTRSQIIGKRGDRKIRVYKNGGEEFFTIQGLFKRDGSIDEGKKKELNTLLNHLINNEKLIKRIIQVEFEGKNLKITGTIKGNETSTLLLEDFLNS